MIAPTFPKSVLPRPFSIYRAGHESLSVVFKVVGDNTRALAFGDIAQQLIITGPCGKPAAVRDDAKLFILVGGGCGLASLRFLAQEMRLRDKVEIMLAAGFPTADEVFGEADFESDLCISMDIATDDGSRGTKGTAFDLFRNIIFGEEGLPDYADIQVFTCGPKPMMKAVAQLCLAEGIPCSVILEEMMACGLGACKGCAVQTASGIKHVCKDGPVFDAREVTEYVAS
jgi:dihydroorotate dehydrogenase electron transfer subunit